MLNRAVPTTTTSSIVINFGFAKKQQILVKLAKLVFKSIKSIKIFGFLIVFPMCLHHRAILEKPGHKSQNSLPNKVLF